MFRFRNFAIFLKILKKVLDKRRNMCYHRKVVWLVGQAVKTPASHAGNAGSIPARVTKHGRTPSELKELPISYSLILIRLVGQAVKTPASHAGNAGSIPARVTIKFESFLIRERFEFFCYMKKGCGKTY